MIRYYPHVQITLAEVPGKTVILIHGLTGCMFRCYKCFNYDEIIIKKHPDALFIDEVIRIIQQHENIIEMIVFSGGEFLQAPIENLILDLKKVRDVSIKPIVIYTTGYYGEKMRILWEQGMVDGFHVDLKLPYHLLTTQDDDVITQTIGRSLCQIEIDQMVETVEWTIQNDKGFNQIRSVKYPFLHSSAFQECQIWIDLLNKKYHKDTPYEIHRFISLNDLA